MKKRIFHFPYIEISNYYQAHFSSYERRFIAYPSSS